MKKIWCLEVLDLIEYYIPYLIIIIPAGITSDFGAGNTYKNGNNLKILNIFDFMNLQWR